MQIPDMILDHLADRYVRECIDPARFPFDRWAVVQAEKLGFRFH